MEASRKVILTTRINRILRQAHRAIIMAAKAVMEPVAKVWARECRHHHLLISMVTRFQVRAWVVCHHTTDKEECHRISQVVSEDLHLLTNRHLCTVVIHLLIRIRCSIGWPRATISNSTMVCHHLRYSHRPPQEGLAASLLATEALDSNLQCSNRLHMVVLDR